MKLCVQARQEHKYLDWASEIIFEYRDREAIPDFIEKYPGKTFILTCYNQEDLDWNELKNYSILAQNNFLIVLNQIKFIQNCQENQIRFYMGYPINSYDELNAIIKLGSEYVRLGAPLFFDLNNLKRYYPEIKIRLIPNIAYDDAYPRLNGVAGTWIRPEDLNLYDPYVETIEFNDIDSRKERALIKIYWEDREWPGELQTLITNLNYEGVNRMIPSEITEKRLNCNQKCMSHKNCHICTRALQLANPDLIQEYLDSDHYTIEELIEQEEENNKE